MSKLFLSPLQKGICSKREEFNPFGSKFFPFTVPLFQKALSVRKGNRKSQKLPPLGKISGKKMPDISIHLNLLGMCIYKKLERDHVLDHS